jgi:hypothetical protein
MRDPAGSGVQVDVNRDGDGAHWLKAAVDEPVAQRLVKRGHLRAFSVGISRPVIERDVSGKARGGIIRGGKVVEVSLVDSPANRSCFLELAKADKTGAAEFTGKVFADDDTIAKALDGDLAKSAPADDFVNVDLPKGASISISPADIAKLRTFKQQLTVKSVGAGRLGLGPALNGQPDDGDSTSKGTVTDTAEKAAPYTGPAEPIQEALEKVAAEHPDSVIVLPPGTKDKPVKKAKKPKGGKKMPPWLNKPDDSGSDDETGSSGDDGACKGAHAWVHVGGDSPVPDIRCEKCKTTPAQAAGLAATHDMHAAPVPDLMESPPMASTKGSPTPESASGAGEAAPMKPVPQHREPDGAIVEPFERDAKLPATGQGEKPTALESGMMKSSPEVAAILRFKAAGIDAELGRLHDLTCPAYHPEDVAKCHPFADLAHVDEGYFQRKAVESACGPDLAVAKSIQQAWQAARVLRETDPGVLNDYRLEAHKAFRDANPGPSSAPTPGMIAPGKYNRPLVADGHAATSSGHDGPNSSPQVATNAPDAHSFDRPPLASGHQSPSPSHMKASFEYPDGTGRPQQLNYAQMDKERGRMALVEMHDHLGRQFPEVCPMDKPGSRPLRGTQPEGHPVPSTVGVGKGAAATEVTINVTSPDGGAVDQQALTGMIQEKLLATHARNAVAKAPASEDEFADDEVYKGFKKARKKLGKKVLSGKMTVDEARSRLGRQFSQKTAEPSGEVAGDSAVKAAALTSLLPEGLNPAWPVLTADLIKSAVAEALHVETVPLQTATIESYDPSPAIEAAVTKAVTPLLEKIQAQDTKLAETQRVIDAIADQPDPSTAAFSGLAFNPVRKASGPAGVMSQAEIAERTQQMMIRHLQDKYNASSDPAEREAYYGTLAKMRGVGQP